MDKREKSVELLIAYKELDFQNEEKGKRAAELVIANIELDFQNEEKEKRAAELVIANIELDFQNQEKVKRAAELVIANIELAYQNIEKGKRAAELVIANIELAFQNTEKGERAAELINANRELALLNEKKEKKAAELTLANKELAFQIEEKEKRTAELVLANIELDFQDKEKEKRAAELSIANIELVFQNKEKEKRAAELSIANIELVFQNEEKEKRAAELSIANVELLFQNEEKEKRAAELSIANIELVFQNKEKEKREAELILANAELIKTQEALKKSNELFLKLFDNNPAGISVSRISDGVILNANNAFAKLFGFASIEGIVGNSGREAIQHLNLGQINLDFELMKTGPVRDFELNVLGRNGDELWISVSMMELEVEGVPCRLSVCIGVTARKRAEAGLLAINKELAFQNEEKEKRAAELVIANKELAFQNEEKEKRAAELSIANIELIFQNEEKEKRAAELVIANRELEQFAYIASHDLQEPLRTISNYMTVFEEDYVGLLDDKAYKYLDSVNNAIKRMSVLVKSLLDFSRLDRTNKLVFANCNTIIADVIADLDTLIKTSGAIISVGEMPHLNVYEVELHQVFQNLLSNCIKFQKKDTTPLIRIGAEKIKGEWRFAISDNGIGIEAIHYDRVFEIFRRLHTTREYEGNGIGLANCKKIVQLHKGRIWLESELGKGSTFYFTISNLIE